MTTKTSLFKFESIDQENGSCTVRFINPYGVIETGEKTLDDFKEIVNVPTGSFQLDGTPITVQREIITNDNPNEDLVYAYDIPMNNDGSYISGDDLVDYIAKQYPFYVFESKQARKNAPVRTDLNQLSAQEFNIELLPESVNLSLQQIKDQQLNFITVARDNELNQLTCQWDGDLWDARETDSTRITNVLTMIEQAQKINIPTPPAIDWRTYDNKDRSLSIPQLIQLGASMFLAQQTVWAKQAQLKNAIIAATTIEQAEAINW